MRAAGGRGRGGRGRGAPRGLQGGWGSGRDRAHRAGGPGGLRGARVGRRASRLGSVWGTCTPVTGASPRGGAGGPAGGGCGCFSAGWQRLPSQPPCKLHTVLKFVLIVFGELGVDSRGWGTMGAQSGFRLQGWGSGQERGASVVGPCSAAPQRARRLTPFPPSLPLPAPPGGRLLPSSPQLLHHGQRQRHVQPLY